MLQLVGLFYHSACMDGLSSGLVACLVPFGIGAGFLLLLILSSIKQINQYERGILFEMGRYKTIVDPGSVSYTHLRAHETVLDLVCRLLLEKKNK